MKKLLCLFVCLVMVLSLCSCKKAGSPESTPTTDPATGAPKDPSNPSDPTDPTDPSDPTDPEEPADPEVPEEPEDPTPKTTLTYSKYTYQVYDPENTRGLATKRYEFSYGVAKDGKPHSQSVLNQQTFDSFQNVEALALDTKTGEKVMYLTFDCGYEYQNLTADILDTLKEKNVKVAFFITLSYAKENPQLVQRMISEGHIVGNHSTTHPDFNTISRTQMVAEIAELDAYLRDTYNYTSPYFRFPTGAYSENTLELVTSLGFRSIFWSVAHADWDTANQKGADNAFDTVTARFHPGAVILLHAVSRDNAEALGRMIDYAVSEDYTFQSLDYYYSK